ncbi:MAG: peptidylprolyl isomerase [Candidatus Obscuribacterales bacterium]|nr:peptidylprolyl isomerase [Candidatus Obscuribacterales bacterium]
MRFPLILAFTLTVCLTAVNPVPAKDVKTSEGTIKIMSVTVGPFDLHRKYRSMEGPWVAQDFRLGDLVASEQVTIPESAVTFVEGNTQAPAMNSSKEPSMNGAGGAISSSKNVTGLVDASSTKRELLWFKGVKLEVIDENGKVLPTAEFICHFNMDVDPAMRKSLFPGALTSGNTRVMTLTQGQTSFHFPEGTAVPCASDELWRFTFQAANRTSETHRRVKHRMTLEFIKDSQAQGQMKALAWYVPYIAVVTDGSSPEAMAAEHSGGPNCMVTSSGDNAPNSVKAAVFKDRFGRNLTGHWIIPPGTSTWSTPISDQRDPGFGSRDVLLYAAWTHIHPLCTKASLVQCSGDTKKPIFTSTVTTKTKGGLEILNIDNIYSKTGIPIKGNEHYQLEATYENSTNEKQDSMVSHGLYVGDEGFTKPDWKDSQIASAAAGIHTASDSKNEAPFCGVRNSANTDSEQICSKTKSIYDVMPPYPLFDPKTDGPVLNSLKMLELYTSAGKLHIALNPQLAPQNVTQIYKLLTAGAFDGTPIDRYEPNFVLQISEAQKKVDGSGQLSHSVESMLRRLPLETPTGTIHKKGSLSMAHYDNPNTAVTSFSIMLGEAPHLDNKYTIIGAIVPDNVTVRTLEQMQKNFSVMHPFIMGVRDISDILNASAAAPTK